MINVTKAERLILENLPVTKRILLPLGMATDYHISENILAERNHPPFDRITHDGIAINLAIYKGGRRQFKIESYAAAGAPAAKLTNYENCIEVATGAPLPVGCDTIVPYELVTISDKTANVKVDNLKIGNCLHMQGSDAKKDDVLLKTGTKIGIAETTILAANGYAEVNVFAKPDIGILATGDELVDIDAKIQPHQIRRSNDVTLATSLRLNGFINIETYWLPDNKNKIIQHLKRWLAKKDVIIITGGVSKGTYDYIPAALEKLGVKEIFHNVAQRPGKPLWFGKIQTGQLIFGLPGNPVSCLTCLTRYVIPALVKTSGGKINEPEIVKVKTPVTPNNNLTLFLPVSKRRLKATKTSGDFISLQNTDGFVEVPIDYTVGQKLTYYPWRQL